MRIPATIGTTVLLMLGVLAFSVPAQASGSDDLGARFAFLLGEWDCATRFMGPDGSFREGKATWTGRYILDGWAIKDEWVSHLPDGSKGRGNNYRSYNTRSGKWDNRWLAQGGGAERAVVVGHDRGGAIAWQVAMQVAVPGAGHFLQQEKTDDRPAERHG